VEVRGGRNHCGSGKGEGETIVEVRRGEGETIIEVGEGERKPLWKWDERREKTLWKWDEGREKPLWKWEGGGRNHCGSETRGDETTVEVGRGEGETIMGVGVGREKKPLWK
jgi:hypothetical protein